LMDDQLHIHWETRCQILHNYMGKSMICIKYVPHNLVNETEEASQLVKISPTSITLSHTLWTASWLGFQYNPEIIWTEEQNHWDPERFMCKVKGKNDVCLFWQIGCDRLTICAWRRTDSDFYVQVLGRLLKWVLSVKLKVWHQDSWAFPHDNTPAYLLILLTLKHFLAHRSALMSLVIWLQCQLFCRSVNKILEGKLEGRRGRSRPRLRRINDVEDDLTKLGVKR
jgi:hypothetical protein